MKKIQLLIFTLITMGANAQTLVDTNKTWNVVECMNFGGCGTIVLHFGADTTIGLHQYKILIINSDSGGGSFVYPVAAREDTITKQIFFYGNNEYLAYDFSLNQGDTFTTNINGCGFQMAVDSVDTVMLLNGDLRKRMFLSNFETWVEGVGSLWGLTNMGIYFCAFDIYPELICFKENTILKYLNASYTNCFYNTLSISELSSKNNISINPNPLTLFTTFSFDNPLHENFTVKILNTNGKIIKQYSNLKGTELKIDRDEMNSGVYFFQLMNEQRLIENGKLIIQ